MILKMYLLSFHFLTGIFFSGGIIIAMMFFFRVTWSKLFRDLAPLWKKLSFFIPVLYLPLLIWGQRLFPWGEMKGHKSLYYQNWFMILRAVLISTAAIIGARLSERLPAVTIIFYFFAGTFIAVDWGLGLETHWSSNIYGLAWLVTFAFAFFAIITGLSSQNVEPKNRKDLAHLLITLAITWGYLQYSQFIILWMGNKPQEVKFYIVRNYPWGLMSLILSLKIIPILGVGFFPSFKESVKVLQALSILVLLGTWVELEWLLGPPLHLPIFSGLLGSGIILLAITSCGFFLKRRA